MDLQSAKGSTFDNIVNASKFPRKGDILAMFGLAVIMQLIGGFIGMGIGAAAKGLSESLLTLITYVCGTGLALVGVLVYRRIRKATDTVFHYHFKWFNAALVIWGVILISAISVVEEPLLNLMPDKWLKIVNASITTGVWGVVMTVVAAPILEEMLFRGAFLETIRSRWGATIAIVVSAALFGLIHGIPQQVINAFLVGLVLGYIYVVTESLVAVIVLHAINNGIAYVTLTLFPDSSSVTLRDIITNDTAYWIVYAVSAVVVVAAVIAVALISKRKKQERIESTAAQGNNTETPSVN